MLASVIGLLQQESIHPIPLAAVNSNPKQREKQVRHKCDRNRGKHQRVED